MANEDEWDSPEKRNTKVLISRWNQIGWVNFNNIFMARFTRCCKKNRALNRLSTNLNRIFLEIRGKIRRETILYAKTSGKCGMDVVRWRPGFGRNRN